MIEWLTSRWMGVLYEMESQYEQREAYFIMRFLIKHMKWHCSYPKF